MSIIRLNTNQKILKEITIEAILESPKQIEDKDEEYRREIRLFRDILRFIGTIDEKTMDKREKAGICKIESFEFRESFKTRTLCNWLLENNIDIRNHFADKPIAKTYRAHTITSRISNRLKKLIELGLISIDDEKIESERNGEETYQYHVENNGFLIVSMLNLQNFAKSSDEYKKIFEFILNRFLLIIPQGYKSSGNYYYYFLKELFHNCIDKYQDILYYFFNLILQHQFNLEINFAILRNKINNKIYEKIIEDDEFRLLLYRSLYEFKTWFWIRGCEGTGIEDLDLNQQRKEAPDLIKMQFKLDIESQIDEDILAVLKMNTDVVESFQNYDRQNSKGINEEILPDNDKSEQMFLKPVLDFGIRNEWEKKRNHDLSNADHITLIVKCSNLECNRIYPYPFEVERESFSKIPCKFCKKNVIKYYDMKTELDDAFIGSRKSEPKSR